MEYLITLCAGASIPILYSRFSKESPSLTFIVNNYVNKLKILYSTGETMFNKKFFSPQNVNIQNCPSSSKFVPVFYNMKWYNIPLTIIRGPNDFEINSITNEENNDVTNIMLSFMGPRGDFFGYQLTPSYFGYNKLSFETTYGDYSFSANQSIIFTRRLISMLENISEESEKIVEDHSNRIISCSPTNSVDVECLNRADEPNIEIPQITPLNSDVLKTELYQLTSPKIFIPREKTPLIETYMEKSESFENVENNPL